MNRSQKHLIKVDITLKKVGITVRFPCSLAFSVKTQKSLIQSNKMYELKNGQSIIQQTISVQLDVNYIAGKYQEKKLILTVYMVSANGKIPAGSVTINPTLKTISENRVPLQKCPDRNAYASITQKFDVFSIQAIQQDARIPQLMLNPKQSFRASTNKSIQKNSTSNVADILRRSRQSRQNSSISKQPNQKHKTSQVQTGNRTYTQRALLKNSIADRSIQKVQPNRLIYTRERQQVPRIPINYNSRMSRVQSNYSIDYQLGQESQESHEQQIKVLRLQKQKAEYIKEITTLKTQLETVNQFRVSFLENQIQRLKTQQDQQYEEIIKLKDNLKIKQKNQRDLISQINTFHEENDKKKTKLNVAQTQFKRVEIDLNRREKQIAQMRQENKRFRQQVDDLTLNLVNQEKKIQLKENSYKQQVKKLNEKYAISQTQRQKATLQLSNLLSQMQNSQKKGQISIKQKERNFIEERTKLSRKVDQLEEHKKRIFQELQTFKQINLQFSRQIQELKRKITAESQLNLKLSTEIAETKSKFNVEKKDREQFEKKSIELQKLLEQQKSIFKKKYADLSQQISKTRSQLDKTQASTLLITQKNQELEQVLNTRKTQRSTLDVKFNSLKKQNQSLKKQDSQRQRLAQTLSVQNMNNEQKINNLRAKLEQQNIRFQRMQQQYENQIKYLIQNKTYLEEDLNDYKQALDREVHKSSLLESQNKILNEQILELNRQILQFLEKQSANEAKVKQLEYENQQYLQQVNNLELKNKQFKAQISQRGDKFYTLEKAIKGLEQQKYLLEQRVIQLQKSLKQNNMIVKQGFSQREKKISQKSDELSNLRKSNQQSRSLILNLKSQVNQAKTLSKLKSQQAKQLKQQNEKMNKQIDQLKQQIQDKKKQLLQLQIQHDNQQRSKSSLQQTMSKTNEENQKFKENTIQALKQFFQILYTPNDSNIGNNFQFSPTKSSNKGSNFNRFKLKCFPDEQMSVLQLECISKRNQMITKFNNTIYSLQEDIKAYQNQIQKLKSLQSQREQQFEQDLFCQKQKLNSIIQEKQNQINRLQVYGKQIEHLLEDSERQNEQLHNEVVKLGESFDQAAQELKFVAAQKNQLKGQNQIFEQEVQRFKLNQIKLRTSYQQKMKQLNERFDYTTTQIKSSSGEVEKKYIEMTKLILQRQQKQKQLVGQLSDYTQLYSLQKKKSEQYEKIIQQYEIKYEKSQKSISQRNKQLNQLFRNNESLTIQLNNQNIKNKQFQKLNKKLLQQIHQLSINNQNLDFKLIQSLSKHQQLQKQLITFRSKHNQNQQLVINQSKQLQQKYNSIKSQYQINKLQLQRLIAIIQSQQLQVNQLKQQNNRIKCCLMSKQDQLFNLQNVQKQQDNQIEMLNKDVASYQEQLFRVKQSLQEMEELSNQYLLQLQSKKHTEQQLIALRQQLSNKQLYYQQLSKTLQQSLVQAKKQLSNKSTKQEQQRKSIRQLQAIIQQKQIEIHQAKSKITNQTEKDKRLLHTQINQIQKQSQNKLQQYLFEKEHLQADIKQKATQIQELHQILTSNQHLIAQQEKQLRKRQLAIRDLENNLNSTLNQWNNQKSTYHPTDQKIKTIKSQINKFERFSKEIDAQSKQLVQISKRKSNIRGPNDQNARGISQILRQIGLLCMRTKTKLIGRCQNDKDKQIIISDYRVLQQKLESAMKSNGVMKPMGFH